MHSLAELEATLGLSRADNVSIAGAQPRRTFCNPKYNYGDDAVRLPFIERHIALRSPRPDRG